MIGHDQRVAGCLHLAEQLQGMGLEVGLRDLLRRTGCRGEGGVHATQNDHGLKTRSFSKDDSGRGRFQWEVGLEEFEASTAPLPYRNRLRLIPVLLFAVPPVQQPWGVLAASAAAIRNAEVQPAHELPPAADRQPPFSHVSMVLSLA